MTARPICPICPIVVAVVVAAAHTASAGALDSDPAVGVVELAAGTSGSGGPIVLRNSGTTAITASGITAAPGCSAAVQLSPLAGFTLAPGATQSLAIACAPAPAGMQRCAYQVRAPDKTLLAELEAVCAYGVAPGLEADRTAVDLGTVMVGNVSTSSIALHNTGASQIDHLFIEITDLAGDFAVAAPCNPDARACDAGVTLPADDTTSLAVTCTPRSAGMHTAALHVVSSAGTRLAAPIALACTGVAATTPVLSTTPGAVDVGRVAVIDATATTGVHLGNAGARTLRVLGVQLLDGGTGAAADWTVSAGAPCNPAIPPLCLLGAGRTADLDLVFDPRALGVRDAILLVNYHDTADRSIAIPLHGIGDSPTLESIGNPATLDFGALRPGSSGTLRVTLSNRGSRDLVDGKIQIDPADAPFSVSPGPSVTIAAAGTTPVTVTCAPTSAGAFTASLRLSAPDVTATPSDIALRCTGDPDQALTAAPRAVMLGEVRLPDTITTRVMVTGPGNLVRAELDVPIPGVTVRGAPAPMPAVVELAVTPTDQGILDNHIHLTPDTGPPSTVAITGTAVVAQYDVPAALSLGTFCVDQPTIPRTLALDVPGSATLQLSAPTLQRGDSPFDLTFIAPLGYPATLLTGERATIAVTPRRQRDAGTTSDAVIWQTDIADGGTARTALTATFIGDGGAIAPDAIGFGAVAIYTPARPQQVTLQNCSSSAIQLDAPIIPAPFSIDSPNFPSVLGPSEIAAFSVGFHPTQPIPVTKMMAITSPQLSKPLTVELSGEGTAGGSGSGSGSGSDGGESTTSFYACGGCAARDPSSALALGVVALAVLVPRRRRRRSASGPSRCGSS